MGRQQILDRERRWARFAGITAIASAPLFILSFMLEQAGPVPISGLDTERFTAVDANATELFGWTLMRSLAFFLIMFPLLYLFRAAQARSERVSPAMIGFVFIGPTLLAIQGMLGWAAETSVASDYVAQAGRGGDIYTLLDDLADNSTLFEVAGSLYFPAVLGILVAMIYVPLQSMRVGLLTRFFATFGMALGAASLLFIPALAFLALTLWFGWLGFVILDRVPRGRPPAWDAGVAIPWPRPGDESRPSCDPDTPGREAEEVAGVGSDASEVFESPAPAKDHSARRERARKKKRKRRA
jgi:hypothetical protein